MSDRTPVSKRLRYEVMRRDDFTCRYCRRSDLPLEIDHVVPVALGGADAPENLVAACEDCNAGKAATGADEQLVADVEARAEQWAAAIRRAAQIQRGQTEARERYVAGFDDAWSRWGYAGGEGRTVDRSDNWRATVAAWRDAGLELATLIELVDDVLPRQLSSGRHWPYFCGAVRNVVRERQAIAQGLLANGFVAPPPSPFGEHLASLFGAQA